MSERVAFRWTERHYQGLFQPTAVLPVQHWGTRSPASLPETRLMAAVLDDAISCIRKYRFVDRGMRRRAFREAEQWFMSRDTGWPFAFERICDVLRLDAESVRRNLQLSG
jgi:hypothetical protein